MPTNPPRGRPRASQYSGKYEVIGDVELSPEEHSEAKRQIEQADSEKPTALEALGDYVGARPGLTSETERTLRPGLPARCPRCGADNDWREVNVSDALTAEYRCRCGGRLEVHA